MEVDKNGDIIKGSEEGDDPKNMNERWFDGEPTVINPSAVNPHTGEALGPNPESRIENWDRLKGGGTVPADGTKHYMTVAGFTYEIKRCKCVLCDVEFASPQADRSLTVIGVNMRYYSPRREVGKLCWHCWQVVYIEANVEANVESMDERQRFIEIMGKEAGLSSEESLKASEKLKEIREKLQEQQWQAYMEAQKKGRQ